MFFKSPSDFGGVGVVSSRSGLSVFGGSIVWAGSGSVTYSKNWDSASLGSNCPVKAKPKVRGFDLTQAGAALSGAEVAQAINIVWNTALAEGIGKNGVIFDSVVLLYAPTAGYTGPDGAGFDPKTAEYIVLVNAGSN